ncbi:MAG: tetratricopeptide repeat protein [Nitrospirales bacterium]
MSPQLSLSKATVLGFIMIQAFSLLIWPAWSQAQQGEAEVSVAQGVLAYEQQRYSYALPYFLRAVELDARNVRAHYYTGLTYLALKKPEQAIAPLDTARQLRPSDPDIRFQLGVAYFSIKDYDKAGQFLEGIYQETPDRENLGYYVGVSRYQDKKYSQAVEAFDKMVTTDSNLQQLTRFYRGLALGVLGLPQEAIAELEAAQRIQAVSPISSASIRIRDELLATRRVTETQRFRAQISLGGYYDDNVAINPNSQSINNPAQQLTLNSLRSRETTSPGMLASVLLDYAFFRKGPMEATATYSFFQTLNFHDNLNKFNLQNHLVGLSGFYRGVARTMPYQVGLQYTYDYLFLDMDGFLSRHTPTLSGTLIPPSFTIPVIGTVENLTNVLVRYQVKQFFREPADNDPRFQSESRDAYNIMTGFVHSFRFSQDKVLVRIGYQYDNEAADGVAFSYRGNRLLTGGQVTVPWGNLTVRYDYDVHWRDYKNAQTLFTDANGNLVRRDDTQQTHLVQIIKPLPYNLTFTAQYQHIHNGSNIPVYDYTKNVFTGLVTWTY